MPDRGMSGMEKAKYVLFGKSGQSAPYVWQDREVRFDSPISALDCRTGETVIDSMVKMCFSPSAGSHHSLPTFYQICLCCRVKLRIPRATMGNKAS